MFIEQIQTQLPTDDLPETHYVRCRFHLAEYSDSLFAEYGIPFHQSLENAVPKRRAEFLAGRYCAKRALENLGTESVYVDVGENRRPVWPTGVVGSISHDSQNAIAIVKPQTSPMSSIGVDIEKWIEKSDDRNIKDLIVNGNELQLLMAAGLPEDVALTIVFSAKESFFKAVYHQVGEYFGFEEARLTEFQTGKEDGQLRLNVSEYLRSEGVHQEEIKVCYFFESDGVLTLCSI